MPNPREIMELQRLAGGENFSKRTVAEVVAQYKLVDLLCQATFGVNKQTIESYLPSSAIAEVADHLITHGVTVQEWISVKDRLPEFGRRVLILGNRKDGQFIYIDQICADGNWLLVNWEVTHWMPLPQPPKE